MPVLYRLADVMRSETLSQDSGNGLGDELLALVRQVVEAGLDPEVELERAYRRQRTADITK